MGMVGSGNVYVGIVDDDAGVCPRLLRAAGMQPITYSSAEDFRADTKHPQFDCLVLDTQLPGMSGLELQKRLAAEGIATPVLFITAHDDPKARGQAHAAGCAAYFRKTDSGSEILGAIRRVVARPSASQ